MRRTVDNQRWARDSQHIPCQWVSVLDDGQYKRAQSNGRVGSGACDLNQAWRLLSQRVCVVREVAGWARARSARGRLTFTLLPASSISHCCIVCPSIGNNTARGAKHP